MSRDQTTGTLSLDQMLKLLRIDTAKVLAQLDLSESLLDTEEVLDNDEWLATPEESKIFEFVRSLALISTKLSPESFEDTKNALTEFWKDVTCDPEWEECEIEVRSS